MFWVLYREMHFALHSTFAALHNYPDASTISFLLRGGLAEKRERGAPVGAM